MASGACLPLLVGQGEATILASPRASWEREGLGRAQLIHFRETSQEACLPSTPTHWPEWSQMASLCARAEGEDSVGSRPPGYSPFLRKLRGLREVTGSQSHPCVTRDQVSR